MTASDYPVTFGYLVQGTVLGKPYTHRGQDRACPIGTPIIIGTTLIGKTGNTGMTTGPHLHTQAGTDLACQNTVNPSPYEFRTGKVVALRNVDEKQWGKYVTMKVGNHYITYAHLNEVTVKIGQEIGGDMSDLADIRLAEANLTRNAVYLAKNNNTNSEEDIRKRVTLINGDVDNLLKDVGITPTQADYDALRQGPKEFVYYLQSRLKAELGKHENFDKVGIINGIDMYQKGQ